MDDAPATDEPRPAHVDPLQIAAALASLLDADDFESLMPMLSVDVVYRIGDAVHHGPGAVVASYRDGSALAGRVFDRVEYSHEIVGLVGERTVRIDYADDLLANGEHLEHHSVQDIEVGRDGRIVSITDQPVAGRDDQVAAFMARHGLTRDSSPSS